jgi:hypothetical protein
MTAACSPDRADYGLVLQDPDRCSPRPNARAHRLSGLCVIASGWPVPPSGQTPAVYTRADPRLRCTVAALLLNLRSRPETAGYRL